MSRYSRSRVGLYKSASDRSALGEGHVESAIHYINSMQQKAVAVLTSYPLDFGKTVEALFDQDTLAKALAIKGIIKPYGSTRSYKLVDHCTLFLNYDEQYYPAIEDTAVTLQPTIQPMLHFIESVAQVHWAYEEVRGLLKWLNRNATPGAIRYYWPSAMKLTASSPAWEGLSEVPTRFNEPQGLTPWLPIIKSSAATCTAMLLLPSDAEPRPASAMWLHFPERRIVVGETSYTTNAVSYHI